MLIIKKRSNPRETADVWINDLGSKPSDLSNTYDHYYHHIQLSKPLLPPGCYKLPCLVALIVTPLLKSEWPSNGQWIEDNQMQKTFPRDTWAESSAQFIVKSLYTLWRQKHLSFREMVKVLPWQKSVRALQSFPWRKLFNQLWPYSM